jgi:hypothetical protein
MVRSLSALLVQLLQVSVAAAPTGIRPCESDPV